MKNRQTKDAIAENGEEEEGRRLDKERGWNKKHFEREDEQTSHGVSFDGGGSKGRGGVKGVFITLWKAAVLRANE